MQSNQSISPSHKTWFSCININLNFKIWVRFNNKEMPIIVNSPLVSIWYTSNLSNNNINWVYNSKMKALWCTKYHFSNKINPSNKCSWIQEIKETSSLIQMSDNSSISSRKVCNSIVPKTNSCILLCNHNKIEIMEIFQTLRLWISSRDCNKYSNFRIKWCQVITKIICLSIEKCQSSKMDSNCLWTNKWLSACKEIINLL